MPMTATQMEAEIVLLKARVDRLTTVNTEQTQRIEALEKAAAPVQLAKIAELLEPVSKHAANILAVQSGALGVRP